MASPLEVLFTPAEFSALCGRDLSGTHCVVFDMLRATSTMLTALANGATRIFPVCEISEALRLRADHPNALLAGERDGVRILAAQTGGVDFDLGNSPREFTPERVAGREIIMTTTNGTRALQACLGARRIFPGAWLNLDALAGRIRREQAANLLVVCAGTFDEAAYEDTLAAGALCDLLWEQFEAEPRRISDSAHIARQIYLDARGDEASAMQRHSRNARRLLSISDLRDDVPFCLRRDVLDFAAELRDGAVALAR
ncbi:MAG TPA: 2-phosphosulfolactate phosphatase [Verrucomicrobiae bacterium]|jgi:2-phosphosulfolactate phosphatase|nr:2-phosphosulfolactate phosphatase [Verrucomicrobiae bacterium]